jgi:hypothetical protein
MNREVHVRFWESPEVKVLRATRQKPLPSTMPGGGGTCADTGRQRVRSAIAFSFSENRSVYQHSLACHDARQRHAQGFVSASHAKNDVHDALHFTEPLRVKVVGHLDVFVVRPGDLEGEACGSELD